MKQIYEIDGLEYTVRREAVLRAIDCHEDNPVYEQVCDDYEEIEGEIAGLVKPVGLIGFSALPYNVSAKQAHPGDAVIYGVLSVGNGLKEKSTQAFKEGDYVKGMLYDAIADEALFSLEGRMTEVLKEICAEHQVGISARLEAPHDISMEVQRAAWEALELKERLDIDISCGFMFDPVKTSLNVFVTTPERSKFKAEHDCRYCSNYTCKRRNVPPAEITVLRGEETKTFLAVEKESLMSALIREGYYISAPCGGTGRCGKCGVQVIAGETLITEEDRRAFSGEELEAGWRLSCRLYPVHDLTIRFSLQDETEGFEVLSSFASESERIPAEKADNSENVSADHADDLSEVYTVAIDIGTTTIAMTLINAAGRIIDTATSINSQRQYGADVISRIAASTEGKKEILQKSIREDLKKGLKKLAADQHISLSRIGRIAIAGNTTMGHLLMGYDCTSLGLYPFTPVNIDWIDVDMSELLGEDEAQADLYGTAVLLPGVSTYVGGDIVSGMLSCGFDHNEEVCLLVDLGTNGEMALGNKDKILVTSTAAGPAFEGGNITWGTGSIAGAICNVDIAGDEITLKTIADKAPTGICGTGVVETVAELVREEIIDEMGLLDEDYFDDGYVLAENPEGEEIVFTQKDVREIQLAKAAIRAGAETLALRYGIEKEAISKVYLAGGFGYKLNTDKAIAIGMMPEEFTDRIEAVGNSSLAGAILCLTDPAAKEKIDQIVAKSEEIALSTDKDFNEFYMDSMMFGEDY